MIYVKISRFYIKSSIMAIVFPNTLRSSADNMHWLASLTNHRDVVHSSNPIILDLSNVREFDENLCAALGVLISHWKHSGRSVMLDTRAEVEILAGFKRNGFLSEVHLPRSWYDLLALFSPDRSIDADRANNQVECIPYKRFNRLDTNAQAEYVENLINSHWWPEMSVGVKGALADCILEVFNNAQEHSESETGVFVCGHIGKAGQRSMKVTIADAGIGFRRKIENALDKKMQSGQAIAWGMKEGNTVRQGNPGGLGLTILKEFIRKNDGRLIVVSDRGSWELSSDKGERHMEHNTSFPGTLVTIIVNTEDPKAYRLVGEATHQREGD